MEQVEPVLEALVVALVELDEVQVAQGLDEPDVALDAPDAEQGQLDVLDDGDDDAGEGLQD